MGMIVANASLMFAHREPWDCSNSVANLGPNAGQLTWQCALEVARNYVSWLHSKRSEAVEGMREWARSTGAWDETEIADWSETECLALFVQNVASELRELGSDDQELQECVANQPEREFCGAGSYYAEVGAVMVDYYTGA